jgi:hypothetical protein
LLLVSTQLPRRTWITERSALAGELLKLEYRRIVALPDCPDASDWIGHHLWNLSRARDEWEFEFLRRAPDVDLRMAVDACADSEDALGVLRERGVPIDLLALLEGALPPKHEHPQTRMVMNAAAHALVGTLDRPGVGLGVEAYDLRCYRIGVLYDGASNADIVRWECVSEKTVSTARARWRREGVEVFARIVYAVCHSDLAG